MIRDISIPDDNTFCKHANLKAVLEAPGSHPASIYCWQKSK